MTFYFLRNIRTSWRKCTPMYLHTRVYRLGRSKPEISHVNPVRQVSKRNTPGYIKTLLRIWMQVLSIWHRGRRVEVYTATSNSRVRVHAIYFVPCTLGRIDKCACIDIPRAQTQIFRCFRNSWHTSRWQGFVNPSDCFPRSFRKTSGRICLPVSVSLPTVAIDAI